MRTNPITLDDGVIRDLIAAIICHPAQLQIKVACVGTIAALEICAHADDQPRLVGSRGTTIDAINTVVKAMAEKAGIRKVVCQLLEPKVGQKGPPRKFHANPNWRPQTVFDLLNRVLSAMLTEPFQIEQEHQDTVSLFQVTTEGAELNTNVEAALVKLFDAIGKANGRLVAVAAR